MARQFQINLDSDNRNFEKNNYHEFFQTCKLYIDNILPALETDLITLKTVVRMVGLLPVKRENFDRNDQHANSFAIEVLRHIRLKFDRLFESTIETEQLLFRKGLATLLCIELLYPSDDSSNDNKLIFLRQIVDLEQRQTIAHQILLQLYQFNEPIYTNSNWTDLFTFVDPNMIRLQDIYIFDSFESYIIFITNVLPVHPDSEHFMKKITEELPRLIDFDKFRSKTHHKITHTPSLNYDLVDIKSIRFLIEFTQSQPTCDHASTKQFLNSVQQSIKMDNSLKYKIEIYFDNLEMHVGNLEPIGNILSLKHAILDRIKKDELLRKSLKKINSHEYCIQWFKCFFAKDGHNYKQYKEILQIWTKYFENDHLKFTKVLLVIDGLIDAFGEFSENDWLCSYFIDHIIQLCFAQSKYQVLFLYIENNYSV